MVRSSEMKSGSLHRAQPKPRLSHAGGARAGELLCVASAESWARSGAEPREWGLCWSLQTRVAAGLGSVCTNKGEECEGVEVSEEGSSPRLPELQFS